MAAMNSFPFEIDLGERGGTHVFDSVSDVHEWIQQEAIFWSWVKGYSGSQATIGTTALRGMLDKMSGAVSTMANSSLPNHTGLGIEAFRAALTTANGHGRYLHSSTCAAQSVSTLAKSERVEAAYALAYMLRQDLGNMMRPTRVQIGGVACGVLFERGMQAEAEAKALVDVKDSFNTFQSEARKSAVESKEALAHSASLWKAFSEEGAAAYQTFLTTCQDSYKKLVDDLNGEFAAIKKTYSEELSLRASVSYWRDKGKTHLKAAMVWGIWLAAAFYTVATQLHTCSKELIGIETMSEVQVWKLAVLLLIATVGVWAIRIIVKLMLSNVHQYEDANERSTMLQTYLALMNENKLGDDAKMRKLIFQALFRPSSSGVVKDDLAPPWMAQWLNLTTKTE